MDDLRTEIAALEARLREHVRTASVEVTTNVSNDMDQLAVVLRGEYAGTVESFNTGMRDFSRVVASRFSNLARAVDLLGPRIAVLEHPWTARWRRVRNWWRWWVDDVRKTWNDWRETRKWR
jgi:hypothetical protein